VSARILDGSELAARIRAEIAGEVAAFTAATGVRPGLSAVLVGEHPASRIYVQNKRKACRAAGLGDSLIELPAATTQAELLAAVDRLNADPAVHGILVQLPLPPGIDEQAVLDRLDPLKDVDGFHAENVGRLASGRPRFVPCTPLGIREMLVRSGIETRGRHAVVIGRSNIVGKPMALLLLRKGPGGDATVTVAHTATHDLPSVTRHADILIVAAGRAEFVQADWVKPGVVVIDVGIHRRPDGSLHGDVAPDVAEVAGWLSPVPGGVGPMTVTMLLHNTLLAARLQTTMPDAT
jgi:methylenetetrahydrofolate dehydrogenase (NADP+)/methenyltetrahydrofolate cyclohydrolase